MTEQEWQAASEPQALLQFLASNGKASDRKLRLFAVACSRRMWDRTDDLGRNAVEAAENFADGSTGPEELRAARLACQGAGGQAAWYAAATNPAIAARNAARSAQAGAATLGTEADELLAQTILLREIFANPFRPLSNDQAWLMPDLAKLAQAIYDSRAFDRMPKLADALEKAGCITEEILGHCRGSGPHVRGCWVVDIVLGRAS